MAVAAETEEIVVRKARLPRGVELHPDERVVEIMYPWWAATILAYLLTLGLWEIWRRRHYVAMTNQRLLHGRGIVMWKSQRSVPLVRVQDATYDRRAWAGGVQVSSAGGSFGKLSDIVYRPREAKEFVRRLSDCIGRQTGDGVSEPHRSPEFDDVETQLRRLSSLRAKGFVSPEEFDSKRQEILARL
jgi:hypothetical protein